MNISCTLLDEENGAPTLSGKTLSDLTRFNFLEFSHVENIREQ